jgi:CxxC-x17-CxxC domain-containing protein
VRGETPHFDFIAAECARGIMNVQLETGAPIGFGVLTTENLAQAEERADSQRGDKGYDAAIAVASVLAVRFSEAIKLAKARDLQSDETIGDAAENSAGSSTAWLRHSARDDMEEANAVIPDEAEISEAKIPKLEIPDETEIPGKLEASIEPEPEAWSEPEPEGAPDPQLGEVEAPSELETLVAESRDEQGILRLTSDESGDRGEAQVVEDKTLTCKDCSKPFTFTASEQQFFADKGFSNEPQRCKDCRQARRNAGGNGNQAARPSYEAVCAECGVTTTVPFRPRGDRPVYCRTCYASHAPAPASA